MSAGPRGRCADNVLSQTSDTQIEGRRGLSNGMDNLHALHQLFQELDTEHGICGKLERLTSWPVRALGASEARLVCADEASFSGCSESVSFLPADRLAALPEETSLINGRSSIPKRFFTQDAGSTATVHVPIPEIGRAHV